MKQNDWKLDPTMLEDFCKSINITEEEFWEVIDKFANRELLYLDEMDGYWKLK